MHLFNSQIQSQVNLNLIIELINPSQDKKKCEKLKIDYNRKKKLPRVATMKMFIIFSLENNQVIFKTFL